MVSRARDSAASREVATETSRSTQLHGVDVLLVEGLPLGDHDPLESLRDQDADAAQSLDTLGREREDLGREEVHRPGHLPSS